MKEGRADTEWKTRYEALDLVHQQLQSDFRRQQKVTSEVKQEASNFLHEMRSISERSSENSEREERLVTQVHSLEEEVNQWRSKYIHLKGQTRTQRASSIDCTIQQPNMGQIARKRGYIEHNGFLRHVNVTKLQVAIDELLRSARTSEPRLLFAQVRSIFVYARDIIQDAQRGTPISDDQAQKIKKYTKMISDTANNLMTAVRNFSASNGLSPICLVDAADSHITNVVVLLASAVKIGAPVSGEPEEEDDNSSLIAESPATYYGLQQYGRSSTGEESMYSSVSPVQRPAASFQAVTNTYVNGESPYHSGLSNGTPDDKALKQGPGNNSHNDEIEELKVNSSFPFALQLKGATQY